MILIFILAYLTLFTYQLKKTECSHKFEAFSRSILIFSVLLLVLTNVLSIFHICNRTFLFVSWCLVLSSTMTLYVSKFGLSLPKLSLSPKALYASYIKERTLLEKIMIFSAWMLCVILLIGALFTVPYNYDSMTYHMARIGHWIDNESVNHFVTNIDRQIYSPVLSEYFLLHIMLLTGSDTFVNMLQYVSMIISALFIYKSARLLNTRRPFATLAAFLFLTMPLTISQSVTTQNDLFAAMWFAMFIYYFLWFIKRKQLTFDKEERSHLICIGVIVGLAFITKTSVCASMIMFMPWLVLVRLYRKDKFIALIKSATLSGVCLIAIISESLIRNLLSSGTIMPDTASANIMVATKNVAYIIVNILKNFALTTTQHLSDALNGFMCRVAIHTGAALKVVVNHEAISFHGFDFVTHMNRGDNMYSHDVTPSALVGYLAFLSGLFILIYTLVILVKARKKKLPKDSNAPLTIGFSVSCLLSWGFIMALLRWQPWGTRIMYPALAMTVIMIAHILGICFTNRNAQNAVLSLLFVFTFLLSTNSLLYNMEPAITNLKEGCVNRMERYFEYNNRYEAYNDLITCVKDLVGDTETTVGVCISGDGYDYPLWLMFRNELHTVTLQHLRLDAPSLVPDAPEIMLWVEKELVNVGETIKYGDVIYECIYVSDSENKDSVFVKKTK